MATQDSRKLIWRSTESATNAQAESGKNIGNHQQIGEDGAKHHRLRIGVKGRADELFDEGDEEQGGDADGNAEPEPPEIAQLAPAQLGTLAAFSTDQHGTMPADRKDGEQQDFDDDT